MIIVMFESFSGVQSLGGCLFNGLNIDYDSWVENAFVDYFWIKLNQFFKVIPEFEINCYLPGN